MQVRAKLNADEPVVKGYESEVEVADSDFISDLLFIHQFHADDVHQRHKANDILFADVSAGIAEDDGLDCGNG